MAAWEEHKAQYRAFQARGLTLDMSRGKPAPEQLALSAPILAGADMDYTCEDGSDARNYNHPLGIPEMRRLFGEILGVAPEQVIVGGNSSLNLLSDVFTRCMLLGPLPGDTPWAQLPRVKFICPTPGYDWHFHMLESYGVELLPVPTLAGGPDMDRSPRGGGQLPLGGRAASRGLQAGHQVKLRAAQAHAMYPPLRSIREHYIPAGEQMQEKPRRRLTKKGVSFTIDKPWGAFAPPMLAASYA